MIYFRFKNILLRDCHRLIILRYTGTSNLIDATAIPCVWHLPAAEDETMRAGETAVSRRF